MKWRALHEIHKNVSKSPFQNYFHFKTSDKQTHSRRKAQIRCSMTSRYKILVWAGCAQLSHRLQKSTKMERKYKLYNANYCLVLIKDENKKRHLFKRLRYVCFHQCLLFTSSGRRLSLFSVSYPMTIMTDVGREEMMRADRPLLRPHMPSSARSCLNVSVTDERPSTCKHARTHAHCINSQSLNL